MPLPWHQDDGGLRLRKLCVGSMENNVYLAACTATGEAVVIDAADEADRIRRELSDLSPVAVVTTHGHWDHVQAAGVAEALGVPFGLHPDDVKLAGIRPDLPLQEGTEIRFGQLSLRVLHTPGHTPGSVCFLLPGHLFSGDTLFPGGPGATSGPGSSFEGIMASLEERLLTLPEDTVVHPGHGLATTIGSERPNLESWRERGW